MNNWNKTGKIKAALMLLLFIVIVLAPMPQGPSPSIMFIFFPFISGIAMAYFAIVQHEKKHQTQMLAPTWNDSPFPKPENPFSSMIFSSVLAIVCGLGMLTSTFVKFETVDGFGIFAICGGMGIYVGIKLSMNKFLKK